MFYLWDLLVEVTTAMFCCGRLEEEEESMAQGTTRLKPGKEKRLTEAKSEEDSGRSGASLALVKSRSPAASLPTSTRRAASTVSSEEGKRGQQHRHRQPTAHQPQETRHKISEAPSKTHISSKEHTSAQPAKPSSATSPKEGKGCVRTTSSSPRGSPKQERKTSRAPNNGGFEMGIKKSEIMDDSSVVQTVEILKRPGQTLGFYIREGNGNDRQDGVFISRIQMGTVAESNGLLHVGDEILTVNNVAVTKMSLDDVVILMSIPKKLVLTIRTKKNGNKNASCPALASTDIEEQPPIVVLKKGRSSSATAIEMTEKCADEFFEPNSATGAGISGTGSNTGSQYRDYSSSYTQTPPKKEPPCPPPRSTKPPSYASIFISPQRAEARLLRDDSVDSTVSSHASESSAIRNSQVTYVKEQPYVGRYGWHAVDINIDAPQTAVQGGVAPSVHYHSDTAAGDREYLKYSLGEGGYRKMPPRSASLSGRTSGDYVSDSELRALYGESYANVHAIREYATQKGYYETDRGRSQDKALRGLLHAKTKYGRLPRSHSPECYNSDSEVAAYLQSRRQDPRGFASDHETYTGVGGFTSTSSGDYTDAEDNDVIYSIPRLPASSSSELQQLLQKFNTLSQELQQEQSKLQRQLSTKKQRVPLSLPRSSGTPSDTEEYSSATLSGASTRGSPSPSRRATAAQTTASTLQPRLVRKHSADSLLSYMTYQMEDRLEAQEQQQKQQQQHKQQPPPTKPKPTKTVAQSPKGARVSKSSTVGALSPDKARMYDADGKSLAKSSSRYKDLYLIKKPLQLDYEEYEPYKADLRKRLELDRVTGLDGMLGVHILTGQGLKSSRTTLRDLYCVVAIDNENKARTMIRTGAVNFDWDECFDLELDNSKELSFLVYNWDPNFRHRLCFHGSVLLPGFGEKRRTQKLAVYMEPKGILYVEMSYKEPALSLQRLPSHKKNALFGVDLETVIRRENSGLNVPILVKKCIDEIELRGLESVGIYRLCGSAKRKAELRTAFEINPRAVDLSTDHVSDIHVVTGVLKDYLRELPEPLVTNALYQMLLDALSVRLPDDPDGSAKLMLSILECLPKANQDTMSLVLNHLKKIAFKCDVNKMTIANLAVCFGPVLLCPAPSSMVTAMLPGELKKHIEVLKYLLEIWTDDDLLSVTDQASVSSDTRASPKPPSEGGSTAGRDVPS